MPNSADRFTVLRGAPERVTEHMEQLQTAWADAVAAAAGCVTWAPKIVDDGLDMQVTHRHPGHVDGQVAMLSLQLKSTRHKPKDGHIAVQISRSRFRQYALAKPTVSVIVVAMAMPTLQEHWVYADARRLAVHGVSCWVNLAGQPEPAGTGAKVTVNVPTSNVFDDVALARIMTTIGQGGRP